MNRVIPIEDDEQLNLIKEELKKKGTMPLLLWVFGVNTSLRISDILPIQVKDVMGDKLFLKEKKTGKRQEIALNKGITDILDGYIKNMQPEDYLFKGRQRSNKPITRQRASQIIKEAVKAVGMNPDKPIHPYTMESVYFHPLIKRCNKVLDKENQIEKIRFHDLRHTYATYLLSKGIPVKYVQDQLGHSTAKMTLDTYASVMPSVKFGALDLLDNI